jgi:hypothetical protein
MERRRSEEEKKGMMHGMQITDRNNNNSAVSRDAFISFIVKQVVAATSC